jgi:hypothetical protein
VRVDREAVGRYLASGDPILVSLEAARRPGDETYVTQRWLRDSVPKRLIYADLYGDLLVDGPRRRVLDVGGGFSSLTRLVATRHDYVLADVMAHDDHRAFVEVVRNAGFAWVADDWYEASLDGPWDVVVANDLFPNVDQRLAAFLERFVPEAREIRLSLTVYDGRRFYRTRRLDGDEQLVVVAWDGEQTRRIVEPYRDRMDGDPSELVRGGESIFPNGRLVYCVRLSEGRAPRVMDSGAPT